MSTTGQDRPPAGAGRTRNGARPRAAGPRGAAPAPQCRGFSLTELLVALALGAIIVAGVGQVYVANKQTHRVTDSLARLDESGRFVTDLLSTDIRLAGYLSCGGAGVRIANTVDGGSDWRFQTAALDGWEGGVDTFPADFSADVLAGNDAVVVRHADPGLVATLLGHDASNAVLQLDEDHSFAAGEILVLGDAGCSQATLFQMTSKPTADTLAHAAGTANVPGNCTAEVLGDFDCGDTSTAEAGDYKADDMLMRFSAHLYYLKDTTPPTLVRRRLAYSGGNASVIEEVLVDNVEGFQVLYGVNTVIDGTFTADDYVSANAVTDWDNVVSLRFALLLRSPEDGVRTETDADTYDLLGTSVDPADDRRLRKVFANLVTLRNRVP